MFRRTNIPNFFLHHGEAVDKVLKALSEFGSASLAGGALRDIAFGFPVNSIKDFDFFVYTESWDDFDRKALSRSQGYGLESCIQEYDDDNRDDGDIGILGLHDVYNVVNNTTRAKMNFLGADIQIIICKEPMAEFVSSFDLGVNKIWYGRDGHIKYEEHFIDNAIGSIVTSKIKWTPKVQERSERISRKLGMANGVRPKVYNSPGRLAIRPVNRAPTLDPAQPTTDYLREAGLAGTAVADTEPTQQEDVSLYHWDPAPNYPRPPADTVWGHMATPINSQEMGAEMAARSIAAAAERGVQSNRWSPVIGHPCMISTAPADMAGRQEERARELDRAMVDYFLRRPPTAGTNG